MIKKLVLSTLSTILLFSPVAEARPVCGFYVDKMVYDHERIEEETKYTLCDYSGSRYSYTTLTDQGFVPTGIWATIRAQNSQRISGHAQCPGSMRTWVNSTESIYSDGKYTHYKFSVHVDALLIGQLHKSDIQVSYKRIPGSGRLRKVWFAGTNDDDPRRCPGPGQLEPD